MVPRPLGSTGLFTSPIGLGTVKLGRNADVKYAEAFELPTDGEVQALLEEALRLGITLIDTAPAYGESERRLAPFLAAHRDRFLLCSKAGETWAPGRQQAGLASQQAGLASQQAGLASQQAGLASQQAGLASSTYDFSARAIEASVEESLRRLGTDRLDILLLHSDGRDTEILQGTDALEAIDRLKAAGKVRLGGISAKTSGGILASIGRLDVVMAPFSQADPSRADALMAAREAGMGVLVIKGLHAGKLQASEAVRFALSQPFLDCLVVGTLSASHLLEAVRVAESPLSLPASARRPSQ